MNIYLKWFLVVGLNSIAPFLFGFNLGGILHLTGMITGMVSWYVAFVLLDSYLIKSNQQEARKRLFWSTSLRIPLQLIPQIDLIAGLGAMFTVEWLGFSHMVQPSFLSSYLMTVFTGLYLSFVCAVIYLIIWLITIATKAYYRAKAVRREYPSIKSI